MVVMIVEQEMNGNTVPLMVHIREACEHYGTSFNSLEVTMSRENPGRVRIEEVLGRRIGQSEHGRVSIDPNGSKRY
ncbi:hypothetical protein ACS0TY_008097 [Phlomoides rotata]